MKKGEKMTEAQKRKISIKLTGHIHSEETRKKIGIHFKGKHPQGEFKKGNPPPKHNIRCKCFRCNPNLGTGIAKERRSFNFYFKQRRARKLNCKGTHTKKQWEDLKKRYKFTCLSCLKKEPEIKLTEDHIKPLIAGGSDYIQNIQPLCKSCNSRKYKSHTNYKKNAKRNNRNR